MKADISIVQSKKGTEIMVSGNKINKYGILAAILFTVPILLLFRWIHGENMAHVSLLIKLLALGLSLAMVLSLAACGQTDILVVRPGRLWSKSIASCTILRNLFAQRFPVHLFRKA